MDWKANQHGYRSTHKGSLEWSLGAPQFEHSLLVPVNGTAPLGGVLSGRDQTPSELTYFYQINIQHLSNKYLITLEQLSQSIKLYSNLCFPLSRNKSQFRRSIYQSIVFLFSDIIPLNLERMSCNVQEAFKMVTENVNNPKFKIIDVRTPGEYQQSHLKGAHLIPLSDLGQRLAEFKKDETYLMVCRSGARSGNATSLLRSQGITAINMEGGIVSWMGSKYPTVSS